MFPNFALLFLLNPAKEILLLRRINTPFCNHCYSLPGGKIELGESATATLIREAKHGLGIIIEQKDLVFRHLMSRKCNDPEFFAAFFTTLSYTGDIINKEPDRHDDMQWFALNNLPKNMVDAHRQAIEMMIQGTPYSEHGWQVAKN